MPQDRQVYSELDKTAWSYTPSLVRWRQRYRGVRDSQKINQEISQLIYDLYQASHRIEVLLDTMNTHAAELYEGKDFDNVQYQYDLVDEGLVDYSSVGLNDIAVRLTRIDYMLRAQGI